MKKTLSVAKLLIRTSVFLLICTSLNAQTPDWQWVQSAGGTSDDKGNSVSTDASGNVFVTGYFESSTITFGTTTLTNAGNHDIFIVKYSPSGTVLWAQSAGGTSPDAGNSVSTDAGGNVFVTGLFYSPAITFGTTTLTSAGNAHIFIVKYSPSGTVLWAQSAGGIDGGNSVSTDAGGNVFVTGWFSSPTITFGTTTLTNANAGYADIFIVKYSPSGTVLWAQSAGGTTGDDGGNSVFTDASGNVFVTGWFMSSTITFGTTTLTNAGDYDIFIVKYSPSGTVLWAQSAGGTDEDWGKSVSTDAGGNVFVTGWFASPAITFGTDTLTNVVNTGFTFDFFIAKLNSITGIVPSTREENNEGISISPNPTSGKFAIETGNKGNKEIGEIEIYNVLGEKVFQSEISNLPAGRQGLQSEIDLSSQHKGIYFLKVSSDENIFETKKIIIE